MLAGEFLDLAELLGTPSGPHVEARHRTAISRSYYAVLLEARDRLIDELGWKIHRKDTHSYVGRAYAFASDRQHKLVGRLIADLKKLREAADYEIRTPIADVAESIAISKRARTELAKLDLAKCHDPRPK